MTKLSKFKAIFDNFRAAPIFRPLSGGSDISFHFHNHLPERPPSVLKTLRIVNRCGDSKFALAKGLNMLFFLGRVASNQYG